MGTNFSSTVSESVQNETNTAINNCPSSSSTNIIDMYNVNFSSPDFCPAGSTGLTTTQVADSSATCIIGQLQASAAEQAVTSGATTVGGLGIGISSDYTSNLTNINNYVNNKCAGVTSINQLNAQDVTVKSCDWTIVQTGNANSDCQILASQDVLAQTTAQASSNTTGGSLSLGAWLVIMLGVVVLIIILIVGGLFAYKHFTKNGDYMEGEMVGGIMDMINDPQMLNDSIKKNKSVIILLILVLLIIVVFIVAKSNNSNKQLTEMDFDALNNKISEAQKIAGFENQKSNTRLAPVLSEHMSDNYYSDNYYSDNSPFLSSPLSDHNNFVNDYNAPQKEDTLDDFYRPLLS